MDNGRVTRSRKFFAARRRSAARKQGRSGLSGPSPDLPLLEVLEAAVGPGGSDLPTVARIAGISVRTLQRRLARHGTTFTDVLLWHRRREAHRLLESMDLPLSEIATSLGYSELSSFSRAFRRWSGVSPSAFRERNVRVPEQTMGDLSTGSTRHATCSARE